MTLQRAMRALIMSLATLSTGCVSFHPRTSAALAEGEPDKVIEERFLVSLPVELAYRHTLAKARECLQLSGSLFFSPTYILEADPFDPTIGYARIASRLSSAGVVTTVITLTPTAQSRTEIVGRNLRTPAGTFVGEKDLPNLDKWALDKPVACSTKVIL